MHKLLSSLLFCDFNKRQFFYVFILLVAIVSPSRIFAQRDAPDELKGQHEIVLSYGALSADVLSTARKSSGFSNPVGHSGPLFFTYRYYILNWLNVGLTAGLENFSGYTYDYTDNDIPTTGSYAQKGHTIAAEVQFVYLRTKFVRLYSGIGGGYSSQTRNVKYDQDWYNSVGSFLHLSEGTVNESHLNDQFTFFGIRLGHRLGFFAEFGYGYKGIVNGGICFDLLSPVSRWWQ